MKKRIFSSLLLVLILLVSICTVFSQSRRLDDPIPLGVAFDLVEGLSEEEIKIAEDNRMRDVSELEDHEIFFRIRTNFMSTVDEDKFAGTYYDRETGQYYIYITDKEAEVKVDNPKVHFELVKYSLKQLQEYKNIIFENYKEDGLTRIGIAEEKNILEISISEDSKYENLPNLIPSDSYVYDFLDRTAITCTKTNVAVQNAGLITVDGLFNPILNKTPHIEGSIGCPVYWGPLNIGAKLLQQTEAYSIFMLMI